MQPKLVIMAIGNTTKVFLDGKSIGAGVKDLVYSARNAEGKLEPTLKLLEVNVNEFKVEEDSSIFDFMNSLKEINNLKAGPAKEPTLGD